jgi:hypothetical protein
LLSERGLHARAIQNLAFDFGSRHRFGAHGLNGELIEFLFPQVPNRADKHAPADEKLLVRSL